MAGSVTSHGWRRNPARVLIDGLAHRAFPFVPEVMPVGAVLVGPAGEVVRVLDDGTVAEVLPPGHPRGGAASDPFNVRGG